MKNWIPILLFLTAAWTARATDEIPVFGPASVGIEDADTLQNTIVPLGVLVVTPEHPNRLRIGDGVTPGGLEVRPEKCVTGFSDVAVATTNLDMNLWSVTFGDWSVRGGENAFGVMRSGSYQFYITYAGETTYTRYLFGMDGDVYTFTLNAVQGQQTPWLEMTTNLLNAYETVAAGLDWVDSVTARLTWTNDTTSDFLFFRVGTERFEEEALVASVPIKAEAGLTIPEGQPLTMGDTTWTNLPDLSAYPTKTDLCSATNTLADDIAATYATGSEVESVSRRVDALEMPETTRLWWGASSLTNGAIHDIPTDFSTRVLEINAENTNGYYTYRIPDTWTPDREVTVLLNLHQNADTTNRVFVGPFRVGLTTSSQYRRYEFVWDVVLNTWIWHIVTLVAIQPVGDGYAPDDYPATVAAWEASRSNTAPRLAMGTPLRSLSPVLALDEALPDDDLVAPEPEEETR